MKGFQPLEALLNPASIAVVGASGNSQKIGGRPIAYLKEQGFAGQIFPVNPKGGEIQGLRAYASLSEIGQPVDLVIAAAPASIVEDIVREGIGIGAKAFVIFSSGFAEFSADGAQVQARLRDMCEHASALLLGPNCLGAINIKNKMAATFTTALEGGRLVEGGFGFVSQSGALAAYWLDVVCQRGLGVSSWIATGNEGGVAVADAIHHLACDPETRVIGCYIEDIKDGQAFRRAALEARAAGKPIIAIKAGRSVAGAEAAASHTGALAGEDSRYQALFDQLGILRVKSLSEMIAIARLVLMQPIVNGPNVGIVSVSGGAGVLLADELDEVGLRVPNFDDATCERVNAALPGYVSAANPLDVTGGVAADSSIFENVLKALGTAPEHDSFILFIGLMVSIAEDLSESLVRAFAGSGKQVAIVWIGAPQSVVTNLEEQGFPVYSDIPEAVFAMAATRKLAQSQRRVVTLLDRAWPNPMAAPEKLIPRSEVKAQDIVRDGSKLRFPNQRLVQSVDEVENALGHLTLPVVAKLQSPDMLHKSENGGVCLNLQDGAQVREAVRAMLEIAKRDQYRLDGILLQEMSPIAHELIVGFKRDPIFGPMLLIGRGGIEVELRPDRTMAFLPITAGEIRDQLQSLQSASLFDGFRGGPKGDLDALAQELASLGDAFVSDETIEEIEINPLALTKAGDFVALDALSLHRVEYGAHEPSKVCSDQV